MSPGRLSAIALTIIASAMVALACASEDGEPQGIADAGTSTATTTTTAVADTLALTVSSPVKVNGEASARVTGAESGSTCSIRYRTPAGTQSDADGLANKPAGPDGVATWSWTIGPSTRPGEGTVNVTCGSERGSAKFTIE